jgi:TolB-like protein/Flp pilus assembly protein TadD
MDGDDASEQSGDSTGAMAAGAAGQARDVFISYANQDAPVAVTLCEYLERRGVSCWIAPRDVLPGTLYAESIIRAINGAKVMVLVLSRSSVVSPHVGKEIERASSKQRPVVSFRVDAVELTPALEYFLSESQWVDAIAGGLDAALDKLAVAIQRLLAAGPSAGPSAQPARQPEQPRQKRAPARGRWLAAAAVALVLGAALIYLVVDKLRARGASAIPGAAVTASDKSVAVLPFDDLSEKKDQGYFSDGLSEELIELLAKVPGLRVPARTSSFYFKGKQATLQEIAKALNVSHVLEGSVRKSGETLRITTQLVRVDTGSPIWSETFDRRLDDIFKVQDEIAGAVVASLKVSLLGGSVPRTAPTANTEAYTLFLKCLAAYRIENRESIGSAIGYCRSAVELDPNYAPAWAQLGEVVRAQFVAFGDSSYETARPQAYAAIQRALALDPQSADAHIALANVLYQMDFDPAAADSELQRAIALDPANAGAYWMEGYVASIQGRFDDALRALQHCRELDPLGVDVYIQIGNVNYRAGKLAEAASAYTAALALQPTLGSVHYRLGLVDLAQGNPSAALTEMQQEPDRDFHAAGMPLALDALGRKSDADRALAEAEKTAAGGASYQIALIHAARKDTDGAFAWLDRAYRQRDAGMLWIKADPLLKSLRPDPRFQELLRKMHLA